MPITVSIVEDTRSMRESLASLLNRSPGLKCISAYATGEEAVRNMPADKPDIAVVDIHLPGMSGIECVARLRESLTELPVLMLTRDEKSELIFNSLCAGASGY